MQPPPPPVDLRELHGRLSELYSRYETLRASNEGEALEVGISILSELLDFVKREIVPVFTSPAVRDAVMTIVLEYEKGLSFVRGTAEAAYSAPPLYAPEMIERALSSLDTYISGLFNFAMGALLVLAELTSSH